MDYNQTLDFLFNRLQSFHNDGATAYKPGLDKALKLSAAFGNPHRKLRVVHVAGTNGKGSTAHTIASVLMAAGLRVGLYTSPHLVDFSERIRVDGEVISHEEVVDFVNRFISSGLENLDPSFFELTTIMAFEHFVRHNVDIAVIEVGLGGRLDTTNIVSPVLSIITNISYDHIALLGNTLSEIAGEKAGIIKHGVPVVIGRRNNETDGVFIAKAKAEDAPIVFASDTHPFDKCETKTTSKVYFGTKWGTVESPLVGGCQVENMATILTALDILDNTGVVALDADAVIRGIADVVRNTHLMGRWMQLSEKPLVITDTGHNVDGWRFISEQLKRYLPRPLMIVLGFVSDKDYGEIMKMLPRDATYFFVSPSVRRAATADNVASAARKAGLVGTIYADVVDGYQAALRAAAEVDDESPVIYVGGSTFVVADLLSTLD